MNNGFYNVPENFRDNINEYKEKIKNYTDGKIHPTEFKAYRVPMGVYEQRENNTFMLRIRIPAGGITSDQLETIAKLGNEYGNDILHVTTRQDVQIHKVNLKDTPCVMEELLKTSLTTKGGGGNTVRNITACSKSGICQNEAFDTAPFAIALTEHMIKDAGSYKLPRKYKIAFSGCSNNCSFATINDLGFIAKAKEVNGKMVNGFSVHVAGGMGAVSKPAKKMFDFVETNEVADICDAVKMVFDKNGNRRNKNQARLRFLVEKIGMERFMELYTAELKEIKNSGGTKLTIKELPFDSDSSALSKNSVEVDSNYDLWLKNNAIPQKQKDYYAIKIILPYGEIVSSDMINLSNIVRKYGERTIRATHDQNFLLRWVHSYELKSLYNDIKNSGLTISIPPVSDIVCCTGASTCRLGICLSKGVTKAISDEMNSLKDDRDKLDDIKMYISGCPNACGQHPIAKIGLFGAARRVGENVAPYYSVVLGGKTKEEDTRLSKSFGTVSAKYTPKVITEFLKDYAENKDKVNDFYEYLNKFGNSKMKTLLDKYREIPSFSEDKSFYYDWDSDTEFTLGGRGVAECGAGIFDMIEVDLEESTVAYEESKNLSGSNASKKLYKCIVRASNALLVTRGKESKNDNDALTFFEEEFINSGLLNNKFVKLLFLATEFQKGNLKDEALIEKSDLIGEFSKTIKDLYNSMDDTLVFKAKDEKKTVIEPKKEESKDSGDLLDLRGVKCPFNYVKAKLKLEMMAMDEEFLLYLDDGTPIKNVPNSLKNDGQIVSNITKTNEGYFSMTVLKKA